MEKERVLKSTLAIIPARYASTRFPGKPLVAVKGVPMVVRVLTQAGKVFDNVCVATDDIRIYETVVKAGGKAVMTSPNHKSGTDRCLEALQKFSAQSGKNFEYVVNVQGDEPFIEKAQLLALAHCFEDEEVEIATIAKPTTSEEDINNPNRPKVVVDNKMNALYFSRSPIPYNRAEERDAPYLLHVGLYGYKAKSLERICSLSEGELERLEKLEQLRWLQNGIKIRVALCNCNSYGIDTPEDLQRIEQMDFNID